MGSMPEEPVQGARRYLKSREKPWAQKLAATLSRRGLFFPTGHCRGVGPLLKRIPLVVALLNGNRAASQGLDDTDQ